MEQKNGLEYAQNYDLIVKWIAEALKGHTLEVLGIQSAPIEDVFGFEPAEIKVISGRVDIIIRDNAGALFHMEEQRNLVKSDLYRFAAYHFLGAKTWGKNLTDIILASGDVYAGEKTIITKSGEYKPIVIDFSIRDWKKRLEEIREAVKAGTFENWLELVFLPLYGKETGEERSGIVEQVVKFETELFHQQKIPSRLLAATLIMANKLIDKERLKQMWEGIKMLDIIEIAREKGMEEGLEKGLEKGKILGLQEGKTLGTIETARELLIDVLFEKFSNIPQGLSEQIKNIRNPETLKRFLRHAVKCSTIQEVETTAARLSVF
ncbi:Uncharacterized protein dnl_35950 [Desulfonema limicola]|uniref:DUF4351 domain-containing protein n=1 Tax=Desulfonema limicola TaxID=45656 RepID=A0A975B9K8_9BACT|nr:hypothetical protein [Desulfonema limicola]QTA81264.1 Uncharacterized protein dnl_35950 [Desulfonema limicola]